MSESQARHRARKLGLLLRKDRARTWSLNRQGGYMLIDADRNFVVAGSQFDLDLDDVAHILARY